MEESGGVRKDRGWETGIEGGSPIIFRGNIKTKPIILHWTSFILLENVLLADYEYCGALDLLKILIATNKYLPDLFNLF